MTNLDSGEIWLGIPYLVGWGFEGVTAVVGGIAEYGGDQLG